MAYHHCMPQDEALNDFESKRSAWGFSIVWVIAYEPPGVFFEKTGPRHPDGNAPQKELEGFHVAEMFASCWRMSA